MVIDHAPMEIARGFSFPTLPLTNPIDVGNFNKEQKAQTYTRVHLYAFGYDPTNNKVMWWLELKYSAYTHVHPFFTCWR